MSTFGIDAPCADFITNCVFQDDRPRLLPADRTELVSLGLAGTPHLSHRILYPGKVEKETEDSVAFKIAKFYS